MGRLIELRAKPARWTSRAVSLEKPSDDAATKLVKLIPLEIISGYIPLQAAVTAFTDRPSLMASLAWTVFALGAVFTFVYLYLKGKPERWYHWYNIATACVAFGLWAYLLGGPFALDPWKSKVGYDQRVAGFLVGLFTWVVALFPYERFMTSAEPAKT
jgi:hypothetical protein